MAEKKKTRKTNEDNTGTTSPSLPLIAVIIVGVAAAFALGAVLGSSISGPGGSPVLADGTPLGARLSSMEQSIKSGMSDNQQLKQAIEEASNKNTNFLLGEIKKALDGKVLDMADPPVHALDLSTAGDLPSKGAKNPIITLVEFSDFECPFCARMATYLEQLMDKQSDKIKLIFVDRPLNSAYRDGFPFHPYSYVAHEAAAEAHAQGKFWPMYLYIFEHQKEIFPGRPKDQAEYDQRLDQVRKKLVDAAGELGLDKAKMEKSLKEHTHKKRLENTISIANGLGIFSTPTVYTSTFVKLQDPNTIAKMADEAVKIK